MSIVTESFVCGGRLFVVGQDVWVRFNNYRVQDIYQTGGVVVVGNNSYLRVKVLMRLEGGVILCHSTANNGVTYHFEVERIYHQIPREPVDEADTLA